MIVGDGVIVGVEVSVGVSVGVLVGVFVYVAVCVGVEVAVGVEVIVGAGVELGLKAKADKPSQPERVNANNTTKMLNTHHAGLKLFLNRFLFIGKHFLYCFLFALHCSENLIFRQYNWGTVLAYIVERFWASNIMFRLRELL